MYASAPTVAFTGPGQAVLDILVQGVNYLFRENAWNGVQDPFFLKGNSLKRASISYFLSFVSFFEGVRGDYRFTSGGLQRSLTFCSWRFFVREDEACGAVHLLGHSWSQKGTRHIGRKS